MGLLRIWLLVFCALSAASAGAATATTFGTRAQLRECLDVDDALKLRSDAVEAHTVAINEKIGANSAEAARLADLKKTLDRNDKAAIASFNQLAVAHNEHVQQVNEEISGVQAAGHELEADKADRERKCGGLSYRPADLAAVDKERRKAAEAAASAASR